jgi:methylenetetrahydrofolate reductase (NADPH)
MRKRAQIKEQPMTPRISFEYFPPKSLKASFQLWETVKELAPYAPEFVSVTYGAGGTTRQLTHEAVETIHKQYGLRVAAHLTCVEATKAETLEIADRYAQAGVTDIVALRGDAPEGAARFTAHADGFASSVELVQALAETGKFRLHVGAYPECHPDSVDAAQNITWLKAKIDAGASRAITQFFFEAETFLRFRDACAAAGITAPIVPGIMPIHNWAQARRFALGCGTNVPAWMDEGFEKAAQTNSAADFSTAICTEMCDQLLNEGVEQLHFYTLNRPTLTGQVCRALGIKPDHTLRNVA